MQLSVVVTVVDGGGALDRCLSALAAQRDVPRLEVIVPWDATIPDTEAIVARYPGVNALSLGTLPTRRPAASPAGQHELYDRRRTAGLAAATGELVAILEDRGVPRITWASIAVHLHAALPHAAIGGAIEHGRGGTLNWAVYFCDFGRYQAPFTPGPRPYVSDVNICYKAGALAATRDLWREQYHETTVHWALQRAGETLYLTPDLVVDEVRDGLRLPALLTERVGWGRLFAYTRARERSLGRRLALAAASPLLPIVLFARLLRDRVIRRRALGDFARAAPAILLLLGAWSVGELFGYLTGEA